MTKLTAIVSIYAATAAVNLVLKNTAQCKSDSKFVRIIAKLSSYSTNDIICIQQNTQNKVYMNHRIRKTSTLATRNLVIPMQL